MDSINELIKKVDEAELVLVGIGEEFSNCDQEIVSKAYSTISDIIKNKNYFVVSLCADDLIFNSDIKKDNITAPFCETSEADHVDGEEGDPQWEKYMMWLSCTLNKKLLIIELGASINNPQIIRWPFEKVVELNNKAELVRINAVMPNVPKEIAEKCVSVKKSAIEFLIV